MQTPVLSIMGNAVSRVYGSLVKRPLQRYNVDTRAEKVITKTEDPAAPAKRAPMFDADVLAREEALRNSDGIHKVEKELLDRLKVVYVDSKDPHPNPKTEANPARPLPQDVVQHYPEFVPAQLRVERLGQARNIPPGKVTLDQSVNILTKFKESKGNFGAADISQEYKLNKEVAGNIVRYFEIFNMMETTTRESETDRPDPLYAGNANHYNLGHSSLSNPHSLTGADWVDRTKTLDAERQAEVFEGLEGAKEKLAKRIEKEEERKQLKD